MASPQIEESSIPTEINWQDLDKTKFFISSTTFFFGTRFIVYPSILVKTRLQIQEDAAYKNTRDAFRKIWAKDGIRGFYKGFATFSFGILPSQFMYLTTLEKSKSVVKQYLPKQGVSLGKFNVGREQVASLFSGCFSSIAATIVSTPIDIISQRLMIQSDKSHMQYSGPLDGFKKIIKQDGVRGLWRGCGASIMTYAPGSALFWFYYSLFKRFANNFTNGGMSYHLLSSAVCGSAASASASMCTNILDVARTHLQTQDMSHLPRSQRNLFSILSHLIRREGLVATWKRGLIPRIMSHAPVSALVISSYEVVRWWAYKGDSSLSDSEEV